MPKYPEFLLREVHLSVYFTLYTCLKFMVTFYKTVIIFLAEIQQAIGFSMLQTKKLTKSCGTVVEVHYYELGAINLYLEGAGISVGIFLIKNSKLK